MMPDTTTITAQQTAANHNPGTLVIISAMRMLVVENVPDLDAATDLSATTLHVLDALGDVPPGARYDAAYHDPDHGPVTIAARDDAPDDVILGDAHHEAHE